MRVGVQPETGREWRTQMSLSKKSTSQTNDVCRVSETGSSRLFPDPPASNGGVLRHVGIPGTSWGKFPHEYDMAAGVRNFQLGGNPYTADRYGNRPASGMMIAWTGVEDQTV